MDHGQQKYIWIIFILSPVSHFVYQLLPWKTKETENGVTLSIRVKSNVDTHVVVFAADYDVVFVTSTSLSVS